MLQEHRVFVSGAIWGINSFDQWVSSLARLPYQDIEKRLHTGDGAASTAGLLKRLQTDR
jgi:glucose-6-phosphate isomerase